MTPHATPAPDAISLVARDRVLLYTRGMDIPPEDGVALALESMRRAGAQADAAAVMQELFAILYERGIAPAASGGHVPVLSSVPPLNRTTLLPRDIEPLSFTSALMRWLRSFSDRVRKMWSARRAN